MFELSTECKVSEVTDAFISAVGELVEGRLLLVGHHDYERKALERYTTVRGIDKMVTSLKKLDYTKFSYIKAPDGQAFLCGETQDLIFDHVYGDAYNVGPYYVCISSNSILNKTMTPIHMFPKRMPLARARHLHHGVREPYSSEQIIHPLLCVEDTCWANIGASYRSALDECDITDMFRVLYIYLIRLDWHSPLFSLWVSEVVRQVGEKL